MDELEASLATASVLLPSTASAQGEDYWTVFEESVDQVLSALKHGWV
jgi:hypothetical protein